MNYLNNLHSIIIPETRNNEQAVEAGEIGQRGAGEDREGRPRDEADHIRDGRGNGEVAGEREAFSMYQFTRGEGALKTTQDLFTQAEYFAEEANRLYKVVRQFSYQVCIILPRRRSHIFRAETEIYIYTNFLLIRLMFRCLLRYIRAV